MNKNKRRTVLAIAAAGMIVTYYNRSSKKKKRSKWVKNWIAERDVFGHMPLIRELRKNEPGDFIK